MVTGIVEAVEADNVEEADFGFANKAYVASFNKADGASTPNIDILTI